MKLLRSLPQLFDRLSISLSYEQLRTYLHFSKLFGGVNMRNGNSRSGRPKQRIGILLCDDRLSFESLFFVLLAKALQMRGADVTIILPGFLYVVAFETINRIDKFISRRKYWSVLVLVQLCRLRYAVLSDHVTPVDIRQAKRGVVQLQYHRTGEDRDTVNAFIGATRHAKLRTYAYAPEEIPEFDTIRKQCYFSILLTHRTTRRFLSRYRFDRIVAFNGLYLFNEPVLYAAHQMGITIVTSEMAIRPQTVIFANGRIPAVLYPYAHLWRQWADVPLTKREYEIITAYMDARMAGRGQHTDVFSQPSGRDCRDSELGLRRDCRRIFLILNVPWDTTAIDRRGCFDSIGAWILATINHFAHASDVQLVIKPHPFIDLMPWPAQSVEDFITSSINEIPANVRIIRHPRRYPNQILLPVADQFVVFNSSSALELAYAGKRVVVASDNYFRNKGFTTDPQTADEYFDFLDRSPLPDLNAAEKECLLRYLYFLYFRINLKTRINCLGERISFRAPVWLKSYRDLLPGREPNLDIICDGIIHGGDFINTSRL